VVVTLRQPLILPLLLAGGLAGLSLAPSVTASPPLAAAFRVAAAGLAAGGLVLWARVRAEDRGLRLRFVPARAHGVQTLVHAALFTWWGWHWEGVVAHAPHLLAQVLFYYGFDLLLAWWRRDEARTGLGPLPIVGSVNLFLWFRDDVFVLQFALLALGALGKELVRWERDGRRTHVFNPSSFPLFVVCVVLLAVGGDGATWARDIAVTQGDLPHAWLVIFGLGLVVQTLFATTLVTVAAVAALWALNVLYTQVFGVYTWVDVGIPAAIFLGCNFLVTDPATSPATARGRAAFGALYGLLVFALYLVLRETGGPAWYDKLLCVPFLNLAVRRLDRLGGPLAAARASGRRNLLWVGAGGLLFAALYTTDFLGHDHPGARPAFWRAACAEGRWHACESWAEVIDARCHEGRWEACLRYAELRTEGRHVERDLVDAGYHLALACQEEVASACERVPEFLAEGGAPALAGACDGAAGPDDPAADADADGLACLVLGTLSLEALDDPGEPGGPDDEAALGRAHARIRRACDLGVPEACDFVEAQLGR